ncbi:NAD(P)-dependent alcohol dehydrogenase [Propionimicrobium sp. PCR01-08-3]|uniref:NAD(P)-dependent alcohol dehydrogenase n=1 Tax=Propionimicrobium sp. PCR01-08-3 TaxID=3052086 RepID=UPI00255C5E61|nr:NAD(P)-dependent alcohol dehydrogenase [Propionimicrobium sp. PCR01-08-3]WIY83521.1 NAD(P)-dependent alcohol dehydrogenase [Propionimicrobium sp. PCR01-08-3]
MPEVLAYATDDKNAKFYRTTITRREPGPTEIYFEIKYAGICHSDIHTARGEWGRTIYPLVPGHEIVGIVTEVGDQVTKFKVGDKVGVGCFVDSCGECEQCVSGHEQFCTARPGTIMTYDSIGRDGEPTYGGYSQGITVEQDYVIKIPDEIPFEKAAPLLCAGITLYSPLKHWGAGPGKKVAIIGMGGLGHVGVQIAAKMGAEVVVISQTMSKKDDGLRFGASDYYAWSNPDRLKELRGSLDLMVSTVAATADLDALLKLLKPGGVLVDVGLPEHASTLRLSSLTSGNKVLAGSQIGGIAETQEALDFCAAHGVAPQVELISGDQITDAYDKVVGSQVRYRYVIDTATF